MTERTTSGGPVRSPDLRDEADEVLDRAADEALEDAVPTLREALRQQLDGHRASAMAMAEAGKPPPVLELMGGKLGIAETVLPVVLFSSIYGLNRDLRSSIIAALIPSVAIAGWRLVKRQPLTTALSGVIAVGIGAFIASRTGNASGFFWPSVLKNLAYALAYGVSAVVRWPLIGLFLGYLLGEGTAWRRNAARRRVYTLATWLWCGMFGLRVAVQTPLLLADKTVILGAANIFLGLPLFFLTIWGSWMLIRRVPAVREDADEQDGGHEPPTQRPAGQGPAERDGADGDLDGNLGGNVAPELRAGDGRG